jgi:hypothetical protein
MDLIYLAVLMLCAGLATAFAAGCFRLGASRKSQRGGQS